MPDTYHANDTATGVEHSNRASFLKSVTAVAAQAAPQQEAWDKTFAQSDQVDHQKVTYINRLGISLVADLYVPKGLDRSRAHAAIVVGTPYGAVKEQASGFYAQAMAERGFVTLAHDPSFVGESGGQPRRIASHEAMVEDFSAGVDFLGRLSFVDRERIGAIGVCGSGGFALAAAEIDPRIKAVATSAMYDIGQGTRQGLDRDFNLETFKARLADVAKQRWSEVDGAPVAMAIGTPEVLPENPHPIQIEFFDYYRTPRGYHPRGTTTFSVNSMPPMAPFYAFDKFDWISPRPVLFITGDQAHSKLFSDMAYEMAHEPKELHVVAGAGHVDLYDRADLIPFAKLQEFFAAALASA